MIVRAYSPRVGSHSPLSHPGGGVAQSQALRRRRAPNPREAARRRAWGEKWGSLVRDAAQALRP